MKDMLTLLRFLQKNALSYVNEFYQLVIKTYYLKNKE